LSVWTHHLKDIDFLDWSDKYYKGKAIRIGAGVQGWEAMAAAKAKGLVQVGGECATVGVAGGYTQGGADNVLEWQVVTAGGDILTASRYQNQDLYWALSGGGGGTYGVVISMTAKAHPDSTVGGASLLFLSSSTTTDKFYAAIDKFHTLLPAMVDAGAMVVYYFTNTFSRLLQLLCTARQLQRQRRSSVTLCPPWKLST